jgi:hypothetical protein
MRKSSSFEEAICEGGQGAGPKGERKTLEVHALLKFIDAAEEP